MYRVRLGFGGGLRGLLFGLQLVYGFGTVGRGRSAFFIHSCFYSIFVVGFRGVLECFAETLRRGGFGASELFHVFYRGMYGVYVAGFEVEEEQEASGALNTRQEGM